MQTGHLHPIGGKVLFIQENPEHICGTYPFKPDHEI